MGLSKKLPCLTQTERYNKWETSVEYCSYFSQYPDLIYNAGYSKPDFGYSQNWLLSDDAEPRGCDKLCGVWTRCTCLDVSRRANSFIITLLVFTWKMKFQNVLATPSAKDLQSGTCNAHWDHIAISSGITDGNFIWYENALYNCREELQVVVIVQLYGSIAN